MQPLYSVDHETRYNSTNHTEEEQTPAASESSPLLRQFPHYTSPRNPVTTIIVSFLLIILVAGVIIGIYLLVIQNESENILPPPVEKSLQLVSRSQWDHTNMSQFEPMSSLYKAKEVMIVQTNTDMCQSTESCVQLLQAMQVNATAENRTLPYNFLISSNGQTYEALGWHKSSTASQLPYNGLVLALIGNFNDGPPTPLQIQGAKNFFAMSVSQQHLHPSFRVIGKSRPKYLLNSLKTLPQWTNKLADSD